MAKSRSSTSSSEAAIAPRPEGSGAGARAFVRHWLVFLVLLAAMEIYLVPTMSYFEREGAAAPVETEGDDLSPENYYYLGRREPAEFFAAVKARQFARLLVFVGDSQGAGTRDRHGDPYPRAVARLLQSGPQAAGVVSMHLGGANSYEQATLLLAMLDAGLHPTAVFWSHSIFSLRKNEIRSELVDTYSRLASSSAAVVPEVILMGDSGSESEGRGGPSLSLAELRSGLSDAAARSATVRFSRRTLWEKAQILRRSPLGRLVPQKVLPGTARQLDPPESLLHGSADVVGAVCARLVGHGCQVVNFLSPINRAASPRPFTPRAEAVSYPALTAVSAASGAGFLDLVDALAPERFGFYDDGTPDAFHLDETGHAEIAQRLLGALEEMMTKP